MKSLPIKGTLCLERVNLKGEVTETKFWKFPGSKQTGDTFKNMGAFEASILVSIVKIILDFFKEVE